jgi:hypothetical protein
MQTSLARIAVDILVFRNGIFPGKNERLKEAPLLS